MKISREKTFQSLEFVRDNYPDISKLMDIAIKNRNNTIAPIDTIEEYQNRTLGKAKTKVNWISNRLGKGDDQWVPKGNWAPSDKSFVNRCELTPGKILNRLEIMVSGRAALCCDMSYDRNFPKEKVDYGNVFEIGIEGVWANLTKEHELIYEQKYSARKLKLICNDCNRAGISNGGFTMDKTIRMQERNREKFFTN